MYECKPSSKIKQSNEYSTPTKEKKLYKTKQKKDYNIYKTEDATLVSIRGIDTLIYFTFSSLLRK